MIIRVDDPKLVLLSIMTTVVFILQLNKSLSWLKIACCLFSLSLMLRTQKARTKSNPLFLPVFFLFRLMFLEIKGIDSMQHLKTLSNFVQINVVVLIKDKRFLVYSTCQKEWNFSCTILIDTFYLIYFHRFVLQQLSFSRVFKISRQNIINRIF